LSDDTPLSTPPGNGAAASAEIDAPVRAALNDLLVRQGAWPTLALNPLVAALLVLPLAETPALAPLLVTVALLAVNNLIAHIVYSRYRRDPGPPERAFAWRDRFFFASLGNSLIWGLGGLWVFDAAPIPERYLVAAVILGMSAGTLASESTSFRQVAGFALLAIPPIALYGLAQADAMGLTYGLGMLLYAAFILVFARGNQASQIETIRLRFAHQSTLETLRGTVANLESAQAHLTDADRMASLGRLVAGMAHEINTPVGTALTASSVIQGRAREALAALEADRLEPARLEALLRDCAEAASLVSGNLHRAAELIGSFKNVAVDRASARRRQLNLSGYLAEILISLRPRIQGTPHTVGLRCAPDLALDTYPGVLSQVITNLIVNALTHAFRDGERVGTITVTGHADGPDHVRVVVADDGVGIDPALRGRLFEPFVTGNAAGGGSGLGLSIALTQTGVTLGGSLSVDSSPGTGTRVSLRLPRVAPKPGPREGGASPAG
jgi:signal transduction histidine kinase